MAKCKALTGSAVKGLTERYLQAERPECRTTNSDIKTADIALRAEHWKMNRHHHKLYSELTNATWQQNNWFTKTIQTQSWKLNMNGNVFLRYYYWSQHGVHVAPVHCKPMKSAAGRTVNNWALISVYTQNRNVQNISAATGATMGRVPRQMYRTWVPSLFDFPPAL